MPDNIKAIYFVLWNVRSTGEGEQNAENRLRKRATAAAGAQTKMKCGAEREMTWGEEGVRHKETHGDITGGGRLKCGNRDGR